VRISAAAVVLSAIAVVPAMPARAAEPTGRVERTVGMMGTTLEIEVEAADRAAALAASEVAVRALEETEARLSTWRADSELERLNRVPAGQPVPLSPRLDAELRAARRWWAATDGAFDPAIGPLVVAWGLRTGGRVPTLAERRAAVAAGSFGALRMEAGTAVRTRSDLRLEEGAWGKGAGLDAALAALRADGRAAAAALNLGGQVAVYSRPGGPAAGAKRRWRLTLADPRVRSRAVVALAIDAGSVSTSGNSEHGFTLAGKRYGHLLDPRSGEPAPDFGSLTVWAADGLAADALSTGLFVLGPQAALCWAGGHPEEQVIVLEATPAGLRARASAGLRGNLKAVAPGVEIDFAAADPRACSGEPKGGDR